MASEPRMSKLVEACKEVLGGQADTILAYSSLN